MTASASGPGPAARRRRWPRVLGASAAVLALAGARRRRLPPRAPAREPAAARGRAPARRTRRAGPHRARRARRAGRARGEPSRRRPGHGLPARAGALLPDGPAAPPRRGRARRARRQGGARGRPRGARAAAAGRGPSRPRSSAERRACARSTPTARAWRPASRPWARRRSSTCCCAASPCRGGPRTRCCARSRCT